MNTTLSFKRFALFFCLCLSTLAVGCQSPPSPPDGRSAIQTRIDQQSEGRIRLTNFEKLNGLEREASGYHIYNLDFNAEIEFAETCRWLTGEQLGFLTQKINAGSASSSEFTPGQASLSRVLVKRGQHARLTGNVQFVKKENGWATDDIKFTKADLFDLAP